MQPTDNTSIVLQGEFAVAQGLVNSVSTPFIKTTIPDSCWVITLYNDEHKLAALAHIDDYISIEQTLQRIGKVLANDWRVPLTHSSFKATIIGGNKDDYSQKQKAVLRKALDMLHIETKEVVLDKDLSKRPQIGFSAKTGEIVYFRGAEIDRGLEFLQKLEYGEFNNDLDADYPGTPGHQIPSFKIFQATRTTLHIPQFDWVSLEHALELVKEGKIKPHVLAGRKIAKTVDQKIQKLADLVSTHFSGNKSFSSSMKDNNFPLMLRQAAAASETLILLEFLVRNRIALSLDVSSSGASSGTALEVAKKNGNAKAIELLEPITPS